MRVALDLRWLQQAYINSPSGGLGGVATFSRNLWQALAECDSGITLIALLRKGALDAALLRMISSTPGAETIVLTGPQTIFPETRATLRLIGRLIETELVSRGALGGHDVDVLHSLDHTPPPRRATFQTVLTVYDLLGFSPALPAASWRQKMIAQYQLSSFRKFERAAAIAPISEATARELRERAPQLSDRIEVIPPGVPTPNSADKKNEATPLLLPPRYFLHVGLLTPRKNPRGLIEGFRDWSFRHGKNIALVCVGPYENYPGLREELMRIADEYCIRDQVWVLDAVGDGELATVYRLAEALIFPSLAEGFGLPLVECLASGTPCVTSDQLSMREAAGSLGIYIDPHAGASIAAGMEQACSDDHRARVRREGPIWSQRFSLIAMGRRYISLYQRISH